jgi:hypothetical protein
LLIPSPAVHCEQAGAISAETGVALGQGLRMHLPVVNELQEIVGWTRALPHLKHGRLRHEAAERLLGTDIVVCTPVFLTQEEDMVRAGAPPGVLSGWWTLALCPVACLGILRWGVNVRTLRMLMRDRKRHATS